MCMEQTVGGPERTARAVAGPLLVLCAVFSVTGLPRKCILNRPLGLDTSGQ